MSTSATAERVRALPRTLEWVGGADGVLRLLDQTLLPQQVVFRDCNTVEEVHECIRSLRVRGAPAIGVAAAFGVYIGVRPFSGMSSAADFKPRLAQAAEFLESARPTAVNLAWAVERVRNSGEAVLARGAPAAACRQMLDEAQRIADEDAQICRRIGENGAALVPDGGAVLTHCNAGALATSAWGTALSVLYVAHERGRRFRVFADETRPLLQGARLTAFELAAGGLDVTVLCDNAAGSLMKTGVVQAVIVGADRIAANGDTANKIGTYGLAVLAREHGIPFYVAAPRSTFDLSLASGDRIPIEERSESEVRRIGAIETVPAGVRCWNPAFDVTPAHYIAAFITELGVIQPVTAANIATLLG